MKLDKSVYLKLDILIGSKDIRKEILKEGTKIAIKDKDTFIAINGVPIYKTKLLSQNNINVAKVLKVFSPKEVSDLKDKYHLEV